MERQTNVPLKKIALEMRAEKIRSLAVGASVRRGDSDQLKVGRGGVIDRVVGGENSHIKGNLSETFTDDSTVEVDRYHTSVRGKLSLNVKADNLMAAGSFIDNQVGAVVLLAGMSDGLVGGAGVRVTVPMDIWLHGLIGLEEKLASVFADGVLVESSLTHFEREYKFAKHTAAAHTRTGLLHSTTRTSFFQLLKVSSNIRNLTTTGGPLGDPDVQVPDTASQAVGPAPATPTVAAPAGGTGVIVRPDGVVIRPQTGGGYTRPALLPTGLNQTAVEASKTAALVSDEIKETEDTIASLINHVDTLEAAGGDSSVERLRTTRKIEESQRARALLDIVEVQAADAAAELARHTQIYDSPEEIEDLIRQSMRVADFTPTQVPTVDVSELNSSFFRTAADVEQAQPYDTLRRLGEIGAEGGDLNVLVDDPELRVFTGAEDVRQAPEKRVHFGGVEEFDIPSRWEEILVPEEVGAIPNDFEFDESYNRALQRQRDVLSDGDVTSQRLDIVNTQADVATDIDEFARQRSLLAIQELEEEVVNTMNAVEIRQLLLDTANRAADIDAPDRMVWRETGQAIQAIDAYSYEAFERAKQIERVLEANNNIVPLTQNVHLYDANVIVDGLLDAALDSATLSNQLDDALEVDTTVLALVDAQSAAQRGGNPLVPIDNHIALLQLRVRSGEDIGEALAELQEIRDTVVNLLEQHEIINNLDEYGEIPSLSSWQRWTDFSEIEDILDPLEISVRASDGVEDAVYGAEQAADLAVIAQVPVQDDLGTVLDDIKPALDQSQSDSSIEALSAQPASVQSPVSEAPEDVILLTGDNTPISGGLEDARPDLDIDTGQINIENYERQAALKEADFEARLEADDLFYFGEEGAATTHYERLPSPFDDDYYAQAAIEGSNLETTAYDFHRQDALRDLDSQIQTANAHIEHLDYDEQVARLSRDRLDLFQVARSTLEVTDDPEVVFAAVDDAIEGLVRNNQNPEPLARIRVEIVNVLRPPFPSVFDPTLSGDAFAVVLEASSGSLYHSTSQLKATALEEAIYLRLPSAVLGLTKTARRRIKASLFISTPVPVEALTVEWEQIWQDATRDFPDTFAQPRSPIASRLEILERRAKGINQPRLFGSGVS